MRWVVLALSCSCTSVSVTRVPDGLDIAGVERAQVKGLVQVSRSTLTLFVDYIDVLDIGPTSVAPVLLSEARALGGRPRILSARTSPRGGWWAVLCLLACVNTTEIVAVAVGEPAGTGGEAPGPSEP